MSLAPRYLLISADCHAGPRPEDARTYVDPKHRAAYDAWLADTDGQQRRRVEHTGEAIYGDEALGDFAAEAEVVRGGMDGAFDSKRRLQELEADGIVAEVIFPGGSMQTVSPFGAGLMTYQFEQDAALWAEGCRAYNRWLAEFCADAPGRRAGVGLVAVEDVAAAVAEVRWLREHGVFGGIALPNGTNGQPLYNHPRYEPLWAACADLAMPLHTHSGWTPNYGNHPGSLGIFLQEISWWAHRALWFLIWSGVFERYPRLRLVMTEQGVDWIPSAIAEMDRNYAMPMFRQLRRTLPLPPSQYYARQCFLGASFLDESAAVARHEIGVGKLLWGSDYPHIEGTWPHTRERLREVFAGVPRDEVVRMLGGNAADVYGFDAAALAPLAERFGPPRDSIGT
jgi:predicted TIM-barrel fold metal-dependent hydrolase